MTSGKFLIFAFAALAIEACSDPKEKEDERIGDYGFCLYFVHRPSETAYIYSYNFDRTQIDSCADLRVVVTSSLKIIPGYTIPQYYTIAGDKTIEQQLKDFIDPQKDRFNGTMPIVVEYRTEACKSIRITLYSEDGTQMSDITELARFHYVTGPNHREEDGQNLLISSEKKLLGRISLGTTIQEYLNHHPMVFPEAHFIFPQLDRNAFDDGRYVEVELALENGEVLVASSKK